MKIIWMVLVFAVLQGMYLKTVLYDIVVEILMENEVWIGTLGERSPEAPK
jgi:hypothetical protein